jgi:hypothetical protein
VAVGRREKPGRFAKHVPQLFVLGPFTKDLVFNLLQDGRLLERMRKVGFRELNLINNIGTQSLVFRLDGPELPRCNTTHYVCW